MGVRGGSLPNGVRTGVRKNRKSRIHPARRITAHSMIAASTDKGADIDSRGSMRCFTCVLQLASRCRPRTTISCSGVCPGKDTDLAVRGFHLVYCLRRDQGPPYLRPGSRKERLFFKEIVAYLRLRTRLGDWPIFQWRKMYARRSVGEKCTSECSTNQLSNDCAQISRRPLPPKSKRPGQAPPPPPPRSRPHTVMANCSLANLLGDSRGPLCVPLLAWAPGVTKAVERLKSASTGITSATRAHVASSGCLVFRHPNTLKSRFPNPRKVLLDAKLLVEASSES